MMLVFEGERQAIRKEINRSHNPRCVRRWRRVGRGAFLGSALQQSHWSKDLNKGKEGALENLEGEPSKQKAASIDIEKGMCVACLVAGEESCENST